MSKLFIPGRTATVSSDGLEKLAMLNIAEALWHIAYIQSRTMKGEDKERVQGLAEARRNAMTQVLMQAFASAPAGGGVNGKNI